MNSIGIKQKIHAGYACWVTPELAGREAGNKAQNVFINEPLEWQDQPQRQYHKKERRYCVHGSE